MASSHVLWGWERFFEELSSFLRFAERQQLANESFAEYVLERLEACIQSVSVLIDNLRAPTSNQQASAIAAHYSTLLAELLECLQRLSQEWESYLDQHQLQIASTSYIAPIIHTTQAGRPRFLITQHQLEYLRSMSFSWVQISEMLGVSYMTVYRRWREYGMSGTPNATLTHAEQRESPDLGQTMVWGRLRSMGFSVTREGVQRTLRNIDLFIQPCGGGGTCTMPSIFCARAKLTMAHW